MRTPILLAIAAVLSTGCVSYPSAVDANFGQAVRRAQAQQVIDPDAASRPRPAAGADGQAAKSSIDRYQKSFDVPPAPVNVLNIGVGSSTTGK